MRACVKGRGWHPSSRACDDLLLFFFGGVRLTKRSISPSHSAAGPAPALTGPLLLGGLLPAPRPQHVRGASRGMPYRIPMYYSGC